VTQNSILFLLSAIVQALAAVMAIVGTFMIFVYSLKWGKPPTKKTRRIWLGGTFGLAFFLLVTIAYALIIIPQIPNSAELFRYRNHIIAVEVLAIIDFCVLFGYIVLVHTIMHPKILSVDLRITDLFYEKRFPELHGTFVIENAGTDMARDVKLFVKLKKDRLFVDTNTWDISIVGKGSPYIEPDEQGQGGIRKYKLENDYEFFRGDLHAEDKDPCSFVAKIKDTGNYTLVLFLMDAYGFRSNEAKYSWTHVGA